MTAANWRKLKGVLADALEQRESERQTFIESACGSQADLVAEALGFLRYAEETADTLWFGGRFATIDARVTAEEACVAPAAVPDCARARVKAPEAS